MANAQQKEYEVKAGLERLPAFSVVGLSRMIEKGNEEAAEEINQLWQDFFEARVAQNLDARRDDVIYAVYSEYQGDYTKPYRLTIGYRMKDQWDGVLPEMLRAVQVKEADYAMMSAAGEQPKALIEAWQAVWQSDLDRLYQTDFEVYGPRFFEEGVHEVLLAVGIRLEGAE